MFTLLPVRLRPARSAFAPLLGLEFDPRQVSAESIEKRDEAPEQAGTHLVFIELERFQGKVSLRASMAPKIAAKSVSTEFKSQYRLRATQQSTLQVWDPGASISAFIFQGKQMIKDLLCQLIFAHQRQ